MELSILNQEGRLFVDSRDVADMTGKRHDHLLRDIDGFIGILNKATSPDLGASDFFVLSSYLDAKGETRRKYDLTRIGCDMVANKMSGEKGVLFTAAYVKKFELMERYIAHGLDKFNIPSTMSGALQLAGEIQTKLEIAQPKADKYDQFLNTEGLIQLNEVAKHLNVGLKTFYAILRTEGILMKQKKPNVHIPTAKYANKGYFSVVREQIPNKDGKMVWHSIAYATHSGFDFLSKFVSAYIQDETA